MKATKHNWRNGEERANGKGNMLDGVYYTVCMYGTITTKIPCTIIAFYCVCGGEKGLGFKLRVSHLQSS
jgi:hypothetical protein